MNVTYTDTEPGELRNLSVFDASNGASLVESKPRFAVVVPCFNEEGAIVGTIRSIREHLHDAGAYELIVVNDGSTDRTAELLDQAVAEDLELCVLTHPENMGYGASLKTGILHATSELIVITDADDTYPNARIPELVDIASEVDMVVGSRTAPDVQYPFIRKIPKVFLRGYASWISNRNIPDLNSGLRVFRRDVAIRFFHLISDGFSFTSTITLAMLTNNFRVHYEPISYASRTGKSKIRPIRDTLGFTHLIVRMGIHFAPLRTMVPLLLVTFGFFVGSLVYDVVILDDLTDKTVLLLMFTMNFMLFTLLTEVTHLNSKRTLWEHLQQLGPARAGRMRHVKITGKLLGDSSASVSSDTDNGDREDELRAAA